MPPLKPHDVTKIFNKFAGREVQMKEEQFTPKHLGARPFTRVSLANPNERVLQEMRDEAVKHGLGLRLLGPTDTMSHDGSEDRVNAYVEKSPDGKWRVSNRFDLG